MAKSQIPVVGEPFKEYVNGQIVTRQKMYGSGFNQTRTAQEMSYLNSKTSWVKMASSVSVDPSDQGRRKMVKLQNSNEEGNSVKGKRGMSLAQSAVLHNTIYDYNKKSFNSGVSTNNTLLNNKSYGFGGTEFGLQPSPGITGFNVKHENRGSIRTSELTIIAYNKFQFELIETLYLRLGFTMMVEWGHSKYLKNNSTIESPTNTLIDNYWWEVNGVTHLDMLSKIESERKKSNGNYDAIFGKVSNYSWNFTTAGTYEISISLTSLGDVVESFKVNTLPPSKTYSPDSPNFIDEDTNTNVISQTLKAIRDVQVFNTDENYIRIEEIEDIVGGISDEPQSKSVDPSKQHYIRFGEFNKIIKENIPTFQNCSQIFDLDVSNDSLMAAIIDLISTTPQSFIIKPEFTGEIGIKIETDWSKKMSRFYPSNFNKENPTGIINNIYLSFNLLDKLASSASTKKGVLSFYNFYTNILNEINKGFANLCDLELTIDEDTNKVIIRDINLQTRTESDGTTKNTSSSPIEVFGFNNNTSNFVKSYSFQTQITNDLKNTIAIGAVANNDVINEDATLFSKWNKGLTDRYQQDLFDKMPNVCIINGVKITSKEDSKTTTNDTNTAANSQGQYTKTNNKWLVEDRKNQAKKEKERKQKAIAKERALMLNWKAYLEFVLTSVTSPIVTSVGSGNISKVNLSIKEINLSTYFKSNPKVVERGFNALRNKYITENRKRLEDKGQPSSNIGFIPIELSLEVDGLSGVKIYNQINIASAFLPTNYGDTMEFVIIGVDHKLESNSWTTTLRALSKPKPITYEKKSNSNTPSFMPNSHGG